MTTTRTPLPEDFLWGVSIAGHQNDGDDVTSDTSFLENVTPTVFREPSGPATRHWERWEEDLDLVAAMGLTAFRFSVEWARVEPERGVIDAAALDHYEAIVEGCLARGIAPLVTFSHFTAPHWFAARASWLAPEAPADFARFCGLVMDRIGDRIVAAVTLNEPNLPRVLQSGHLPSEAWAMQQACLDAASRAAGVERYRVGNVVLLEETEAMEDGLVLAHRAAKAAIKARRADLPVGLSIAIIDDVALPGGEANRDTKRARCYDRWLELAREDDFVGVQNYERVLHGPEGVVEPSPELPRNEMGTAIFAGSLAGAVRYAHERSGVPVLVSEHGMATGDDALRAAFIPAAIAELLDAMADGVPVLGYCHWTLMDNFEWIFGYGMQLGLHAVDRTTFERTPKGSARAYAEVVRRLTSERAA
ncbi:MAG TPA: beta-glucosidase [Micrococcales bacterium]|uniref:glycoside hydrolase family 1 protein n=1 Tax=Miniimonas arenae TaxID=676201 RepID=UPI000EE09F74|nr:family 1 glycosylhydrolase [Miniimonas arenae]HCX85525.1 beta-glucosidase [Micrococcales bacterium]